MILKRGSTGNDVKTLQDELKRLGYYGGAVDGMFGPETESAVKAYQAKHHLVADGVVGPITRAAIGMEVPPPRVPAEAVEIVKRFEGFRAEAYLCPANVWTIGYGYTRNVKQGDVVTKEEAEELLRFDLEHAANIVAQNVTVPLNEHQRAALISFVYNVGAGAFAESTLLKELNSRNYDAVPAQLTRWTKAGGRELKGLVRRRQAELELWRKTA